MGLFFEVTDEDGDHLAVADARHAISKPGHEQPLVVVTITPISDDNEPAEAYLTATDIQGLIDCLNILLTQASPPTDPADLERWLADG